jgi:exonuclease SbcD
MMRIVHTSDWHAGRVWKGIDRLPELTTILENLGDFIEREKIDLLLVTGDVFDSGAPAAAAERLVFSFLKRIGRAGTQTVVIAGNHDNPARLEAWGMLAELVEVRTVARPLRPEHGGVIEIESRSGETAVVAALPFASLATLVSGLELAEDATRAYQRYADGLGEMVRTLCARFRPTTINLFMGHTHLDGAVIAGSERRVHLGEEWATTAQTLPANAHYVALGHIHRPQRIEAAPSPTLYAGSPLQLDFGEAGEEKSFVLIEARPSAPAKIERVPYRGGKALREVRGSRGVMARRAASLTVGGWVGVVVPLTAPDPDVNAKVRRLLANATSVDVELPELEEAGQRIDRRGLAPAELYRAYFRERHTRDPEQGIIDGFEDLRRRAEGGGA